MTFGLINNLRVNVLIFSICNEFNLDYENFKEIFGGTFSYVGESIVSKLDEWYQIYKAS